MAEPEAGSRPLRIGVEATSLLGAPTGIGAMTRALLERFGPDPRLDVTGLVISWRGRSLVGYRLPAGVGARSLAFPARAAHRVWCHLDWPTVGGFDLVHGPNFVVPPAPGAAELVSLHDFGPWHFPQMVTAHARAYPRLIERALARGAHLHVDSAFVGCEAEEILGLERERIHVVRLGFDPQEDGVGERGQARIGAPYVLSVGTIEPRKDLPTLVAAMAQLWSSQPEVKLVVVGPDGWGTEAYEEAVRAVGGGGRIVRLGYVPAAERADLLAGAACLAFPSLYEGFGLPPLEAMAASTPVVTTTAGSLPEICGPAAHYVEPGDAAALATAIETVLTDHEAAQALVDAGHRQVGGYSWDTMASTMTDLYRTLVSGR